MKIHKLKAGEKATRITALVPDSSTDIYKH